MTKVSVIFPARNEEGLIKEAVMDVYQKLIKKEYSFEILVVANGCTDKTEEIVRNLEDKYFQIKLINSRTGYGYSLKKGIENSKGDYLIIFNVDFYDLKLIDLVDIDLYGKDFIIGSKRAHWSEDKRAFPRRAVSFLFNEYLRITYGFKGSDTHGIKLIRKSVIDKIYKKCRTVSGIFDTELVLRAQEANFRMADFPVVVSEKRPPRFTQRLLNTPIDIYNLSKALKK